MGWQISLSVIVGFAVLTVVATTYGARKRNFATQQIRAHLEFSRRPMAITSYDPAEVVGLPLPVQNYFQTALKAGQPLIRAVSLQQSGTFNMSPNGTRWKPFLAQQRVITRGPGFDWDASIAMVPGIAVHVHDGYIAGTGFLHATLFGLVTLANVHDTPGIAQGELMRYLAEAAWYPTALLPSQGVLWQAVDDFTANATLTDGAISVTLLFRFDTAGLIASVRAEARGRTVAGIEIPTPWEGRWSHYEVHDGMRIPTQGEVSWMLPEGPMPYWRGRITNLSYEFC